jgi:hypothetical protein
MYIYIYIRLCTWISTYSLLKGFGRLIETIEGDTDPGRETKIYINIYTYTCIYIYIHMREHVYAYIHVHIHIHIYTCIYISC